MTTSSKKQTLRSRLRQLRRRLLPLSLSLRIDLRHIDRQYRSRVAQAPGEERQSLIERHSEEREYVEEQLAGIQTRRLLRRAWRYFIVTPEMSSESTAWTRGWASGTWYLEPAAVASLQREIEEAKKRRREAWEAWAKILGGLITGLVALVSALVSLILAWRR